MMLAEAIIIALAFLVLRRHLATLEQGPAPAGLAHRRPSPRLAQMSTYADRLFAEKKWLAAEKAYLGVLKLDHKNVTAYSHLGIIYSTQKSLPDAIECFEIAARLHPSGTTLQNLALGYFDNHNYIKSIATYEKAIMFEPTAPRYVGLSRAQRKLSNVTGAALALEKAAALDHSTRILQMLADAYDEAGRKSDATATRKRLNAPAAPSRSVAS